MTKPSPITLETARLLLRPMRADDRAALLAIFGDPLVMASFSEPPFDSEQIGQWVQRNLDHQQHYGYGLFAVIHKPSGTLIGDCGLEMLDEGGAPVAELGYDVRSDHWNQGFASEAAAAVRDYAFGQLGLRRLISLVRVGNHASRRVAEKIGMRLEETFSRGDRHYWKLALAHPDEEHHHDRAAA